MLAELRAKKGRDKSSGTNKSRQDILNMATWLCIAAVLACFMVGCAGRPHSVAPQVISNKPSSPRWENDIQRFEEMDREQPPAQGGVVFIGSSSIKMWKSLKDDFAPMHVIGRGFGGSHVIDSVVYADRIVIPYRPRTVVMYAGDNDIAAGKTPDQVFSDFGKFVKKIHAALPEARIQYICIKPSIRRWHLWDKMKEANALIEGFAGEQELVDYIDIATPMLGQDDKPRTEMFVKDGLHLSGEGYRVWIAALQSLISRSSLKAE